MPPMVRYFLCLLMSYFLKTFYYMLLVVESIYSLSPFMYVGRGQQQVLVVEERALVKPLYFLFHKT